MAFLQFFKFLNLIKFKEFDSAEAKKWYPIVVFLVAMIYTGSKALQYLPIPVYTIFKNLTIILIAYGEVLWFGGRVTSMIIVSFTLMVSCLVAMFMKCGKSLLCSKQTNNIDIIVCDCRLE